MIPKTLGNYHLLEPIGQSDIATVYRAEEAGSNRFVAVKVLLTHLGELPAFRERFIREMQAAVTLEHAHLLPVDDFNCRNNICFIVTPYVEGGHSLAEIKPGATPLLKLVGWFIQVATALDYAHWQGLVHLGLKPSNILLEGDQPLVADFGLARLRLEWIRQSKAGYVLDNPAYLSPEQVLDTAVDHRADIYALGAILFELLTGQLPHRDDNSFQFLLKRTAALPRSPRSLNPAVPEPLAQVILKALALAPTDRYPSAAALATALAAALRAA
jgi:serine/threonine protein kinase